MRKKLFFKHVLLMAGFIGASSAFTGCSETDYYDPNFNKSRFPAETYDFGFATRNEIKLSVNYNASGFKTLIEIYDENPLTESNAKKEGVQPIYAAYTDDDSKFEGTMYIPSALKEVYLYTNRWGLPLCVKIEAGTNGFVYDAAASSQKTPVKANRVQKKSALLNYFIGEQAPYTLQGRTDNLYSLCKWDVNGGMIYDGFGLPSDFTPNYITKTEKIKGVPTGELSKRVQDLFQNYPGPNSDLLRDADITNIKVVKEGTLDFVFLSELAAYNNSVGYYYYEEGQAPQTDEDFRNMKKYMIFPNVTVEGSYLDPIYTGSTVRLKYFGKDGNQPATDKFPPKTVVGWFIISDGFAPRYNSKMPILNYSYFRNVFFSNDSEQHNKRFVSVVDKATDIVVLGCEDQFNPDTNTEDYCDVLFFVKSDDGELDNEGKPEIPPGGGDIETGKEVIEGTLAYEDIWPTGGDYDMNDVAIEYTRELIFDSKNNVSQVKETFKPVQKEDAATFNNYFVYRANNLGQVTLPENCIIESETNSIVFTQSVKQWTNQKVSVVRTFDGRLNKDELKKDFDPYIIVNSYSTKNRKEVHLPKQEPTSFADNHLNYTKDDAYYMKADGTYPFAIDIPVLNFKLTKETIRIDDKTEYPKFRSWADSYGAKDQDWYK